MEPSLVYSIPYVLFAIFLGLCAIAHYKGDEQIKKGAIIISIIGFMFFIGLRGLIMSDWTFYYFFFNDHCSLEYLLHPEYDDYEKVAIGFMIYNLICKTIFDNYFFVLTYLVLRHL